MSIVMYESKKKGDYHASGDTREVIIIIILILLCLSHILCCFVIATLNRDMKNMFVDMFFDHLHHPLDIKHI